MLICINLHMAYDTAHFDAMICNDGAPIFGGSQYPLEFTIQNARSWPRQCQKACGLLPQRPRLVKWAWLDLLKCLKSVLTALLSSIRKIGENSHLKSLASWLLGRWWWATCLVGRGCAMPKAQEFYAKRSPMPKVREIDQSKTLRRSSFWRGVAEAATAT